MISLLRRLALAAAMGLAVPAVAQTPGPLSAVFGSAVNGGVVKASPGTLWNAHGTCSSACWVMIFNATSVPSNGSTTAGTASSNLVDCVPVAANGAFSIGNGVTPYADFSTGLSIAISSTACATLTLSTVGFVNASYQ